MPDNSSEGNVDELLEATTALVPPLLNAMEGLNLAGRHLHPPNLAPLATQLAQFEQPLLEGGKQFEAADWPEHLQGYTGCVLQAKAEVDKALAGFRVAAEQQNPMMAAYRAVGHNTKATEALYPVAAMLPPVSRFFLEPGYADAEQVLEKLASTDDTREDVGVMHANNAAEQRGGFSLYVPEYYDRDNAGAGMPLVVAMHGGSGHGRSFLWSWLRAARSKGAIVLSPSSKEGTWSLMGPDVDSANIDSMVSHICEHWQVDAKKILLTGMSDGGTFSYVSGLRDHTFFTHLAPVSASFHPMILEMASRERLQDLPVYLVHGALDWMFPVDMAQTAEQTLQAVGAKVNYQEIADLSHTYPKEQSLLMLDWLNES